MKKKLYEQLLEGELRKCEWCDGVFHAAYLFDHLRMAHGQGETFAEHVADTTEELSQFDCDLCGAEIHESHRSLPPVGYPRMHEACGSFQ